MDMKIHIDDMEVDGDEFILQIHLDEKAAEVWEEEGLTEMVRTMFTDVVEEREQWEML